MPLAVFPGVRANRFDNVEPVTSLVADGFFGLLVNRFGSQTERH
jgi:hypothetical protein